MMTSTLRSQLYFPIRHTNLTTPTANSPFLISIRTTSSLKHPPSPSPSSGPSRTTSLHRQIIGYPTKTGHRDKPLVLELMPKSQKPSKEEFAQVYPHGYTRFLILGAVSVGFGLFLMGMDDQKALALGPEGPLMEEFWDNMRRYGLYALTVSTGVIYTITQPILELLKNPISAILILTIMGGSIYIVSQVVSAMVGVSDFSYDYGY